MSRNVKKIAPLKQERASRQTEEITLIRHWIYYSSKHNIVLKRKSMDRGLKELFSRIM